MRTTIKIISCLLVLYAIGIACSDEQSCSSDTSTTQQPLNPNGDSELALLMRAMFDEAEHIKQQIAKDEPITISLQHENILTAEATEPEKAASDQYKAFATAYLEAMKNLKAASPAHQIDAYKQVVGNCMSCHQALCPGPIVRIKKL